MAPEDVFDYIQKLQKQVVSLESQIKRKDMTILNLKEDLLRLENQVITQVQETQPPNTGVTVEDELSSFLEEEENQKYVLPHLGRRSHSFSDLVGPTIADMIKQDKSRLSKVNSKQSVDSTNKFEVKLNFPICFIILTNYLFVFLQSLIDEWNNLPDMILSCGGYNIENGYFPSDDKDFMIDNKRYYHSYFLSKDHVNLMCKDTPWKTVIASIAKDTFHYRVLLRSKIEDRIYMIEKSKIDKGFKSFTRKLFKSISPALGSCKWTTVTDENFKKDLLTFESQMYQNKLKVGVLLAKDGQRREEEMFCNGKKKQIFFP